MTRVLVVLLLVVVNEVMAVVVSPCSSQEMSPIRSSKKRHFLRLLMVVLDRGSVADAGDGHERASERGGWMWWLFLLSAAGLAAGWLDGWRRGAVQSCCLVLLPVSCLVRVMIMVERGLWVLSGRVE